MLAAGEAASIKDAAAVGMTREAISKAMKRPTVREFVRAEIVATIGVTAMKATHTLDSLLSSSNEVAKLGAVKFSLGSAFGIQAPAGGMILAIVARLV